MRRSAILLALASLAAAVPPAGATPLPESSRVIVSTTLNDGLLFFDSFSLVEMQPPLLARGGGPVRLAVGTLGEPGTTYLFSANHGVAGGSVGIYDLNGPTVSEVPTSPVPARLGPVGIDAAIVHTPVGTRRPMVFVTNTHFALGGCNLPKGSVTGYLADMVGTGPLRAPLLREAGTIETSGPIPWGVAIDPAGSVAYASTNCGNSLDTIAIDSVLCDDRYVCPEEVRLQRVDTRPAATGPDAVVYDPYTDLVFVTNISGNSVTVHDSVTRDPLTTVPLAGAGPIDANLADSPGGARWLVTSNGRDDTVSLVDRNVVRSCVAARKSWCPEAEVLRAPTGVKGGAPEGVDYDPRTGRIFAVNKGILAPSLTVLQVLEDGGSVSATKVADIPLGALGASAPLPAVIAFDVVVQD